MIQKIGKNDENMGLINGFMQRFDTLQPLIALKKGFKLQ